MGSMNPSLRRLRAFALAEGTTLLLLLFVAVPLKHLAGWPTGVTWMGPVHGLAFLAYLWALCEAMSSGAWRGGEVVRLFLAALVPFGVWFSLRQIHRKAAT